MKTHTEQDPEIISFEDNILTVEIINPKSLLDLLEEYGTGENGFDKRYAKHWRNQDYAKNVPEPGIYEIDVAKQLTSLNSNEQKEGLLEEFDFTHAAVLSHVILKYNKETGIRLLKNWASRTSSTDSNGNYIIIGYFDSDGLYVHVLQGWNSGRGSKVGVAQSRKS